MSAILGGEWAIVGADWDEDVPLPGAAIVTESHARSYGLAAEVVIRAVGGTSPITPDLLRRDGRRVRLLFDIADGSDDAEEVTPDHMPKTKR